MAVGAGLASGLMLVAAALGHGSPFSFLALIVPLPVTIAAYSWGWRSGLLAGTIGSAFLLLLTHPSVAAVFFFAYILPLVVAIYFLSLNRHVAGPAGQSDVEWYPVGRVLFGLAMFAGAFGAVTLVVVAPDLAALEARGQQFVEQISKGAVPLPGVDGGKLSEEQQRELAKSLTAIFPAALALSWMFIAIINLWMGAKIARASQRLSRPWPNISMTVLPRIAALALAVAALASFAGGYAAAVASAFTGCFIFAFFLVGLAIVHNVTWGMSLRPLILVGVYLFSAFSPFGALALTALALVEPLFAMRSPDKGGIRDARGPPE